MEGLGAPVGTAGVGSRAAATPEHLSFRLPCEAKASCCGGGGGRGGQRNGNRRHCAAVGTHAPAPQHIKARSARARGRRGTRHLWEGDVSSRPPTKSGERAGTRVKAKF